MSRHELWTHISLSHKEANLHPFVEKMRRGANTVAVRTVAQCQEEPKSKLLRLVPLTINLYRQSAEKSQETHECCCTFGNDWMEVASNISTDDNLPMRTAHEIDNAPRADLVHGTKQNHHMDC